MKLIVFIVLLGLTLSVKWHQLESYTFDDYLNEY